MGDQSGENVPGTVRAQSSMVSDSAIMKATGRSREDWFELLDDAGARDWDHATIARWLGGKHEVDGWWAQGVTVSYEQSRGLREPGQSSDGSFEVSCAKTLPVGAEDVWPYLTDEDRRRDWLDLELNLLSQTSKSVRFDGGERSRVVFYVVPSPPTKSGRPRSKISVQHTRLTRKSVMETKQFWKDALSRLADVLRD